MVTTTNNSTNNASNNGKLSIRVLTVHLYNENNTSSTISSPRVNTSIISSAKNKTETEIDAPLILFHPPPPHEHQKSLITPQQKFLEEFKYLDDVDYTHRRSSSLTKKPSMSDTKKSPVIIALNDTSNTPSPTSPISRSGSSKSLTNSPAKRRSLEKKDLEQYVRRQSSKDLLAIARKNSMKLTGSNNNSLHKLNLDSSFHSTFTKTITVDQEDLSDEVASLVEDFDSDDERQKTPTELLHEYAERGDLDKLKAALKTEAIDDLNVQFLDREVNECTLLHKAVLHNQLEIAQYLYEKGAFVDCVDKFNSTPLFYAVNQGYIKAAGWLLHKGCSVNLRDSWENFPLFLALKNNKMETAKLLLLYNADINFKGKKGNTCLHMCVQQSYNSLDEQLEKIQFLLDSGAHIYTFNRNNETCLHFAISDPYILDFVLNYMFDNFERDKCVKWISLRDINGFNLFHLCASKGLLKSLSVVITKLCQDNATNVDLQTYLLRVLNEKDLVFGNTPLHHAVVAKKMEIIRLFVMCSEIDIDQQNQKGETALHLAIKNNQMDIINLLIQIGKANIKIKNNSGISCKDLAKQMNIILQPKNSSSNTGADAKKEAFKSLFQFPFLNKSKKEELGLSTSKVMKKLDVSSLRKNSWSVNKELLRTQLEQIESLSLIQFSEKLVLGVRELDNHQIKIVDMINQLYSYTMNSVENSNNAPNSHRDYNLVSILLGSLTQYIQSHLKVEQKELAARYRVPLEIWNNHQEQHNQFENQIIQLSKRSSKENTNALCIELLSVLTDYFDNHIQIEDRKLAEFAVRANGFQQFNW